MLRRNLLYTAISRAKVKVILIGQKQAVFMAIHKSDVDKRNTILSDRIVAYYAREKQIWLVKSGRNRWYRCPCSSIRMEVILS